MMVTLSDQQVGQFLDIPKHLLVTRYHFADVVLAPFQDRHIPGHNQDNGQRQENGYQKFIDV